MARALLCLAVATLVRGQPVVGERDSPFDYPEALVRAEGAY
jgi:hypothetical protein